MFLLKCYKLDNVYFKKTEELIFKSIEYILDNKMNNSLSIYPESIPLNNKESILDSRLAWCNGDLGIGLTLWEVGNTFKNDRLIKESIEVFNHSTHRKKT